MIEGYTPPPDAARVWRGFKSPSMTQQDFYTKLGTVFIPATVKMQARAGLCAYIPSVTAGLPGKPDQVPDETAILFWETQQAYIDSFKTLAVRTYTLTHGAVYIPSSRADFPVMFRGSLDPERPFYLVSQAVDWMQRPLTHLIGSRPASVAPADFRAAVSQTMSAAQGRQLAGAIICGGDDYVIFWQLGDDDSLTAQALAQLCDWSKALRCAAIRLESGLWDDWPGLEVGPGTSWNFQFERRRKAALPERER